VQVDLVDVQDRPAAGHRGAVVAAVAEQPQPLVGDVIALAQQVEGLVVGVVDHGFLEGEYVRPQLPQPDGQHLAPGRPVPVVPDQVQRHCSPDP
jgi:hypothetical protein